MKRIILLLVVFPMILTAQTVKSVYAGKQVWITWGGTKPTLNQVSTGNSITAGLSTYPNNFKALIDRCFPVTTTFVNTAVGGQNLIWLYDNINLTLSENPDVLTLQFGTNDLGNAAIGAKMKQYVDSVLNYTLPNGRKPRIIIATDQACSEVLAPSYTAIAQDSTYARVLNTYNTYYASNPKVLFLNNYAAHIALTRESAPFLSILSGDGVHPNAAGQTWLYNNWKNTLLLAIQRWFLNLN